MKRLQLAAAVTAMAMAGSGLSGCAMQVSENNVLRADRPGDAPPTKIGRASCRERVF